MNGITTDRESKTTEYAVFLTNYCGAFLGYAVSLQQLEHDFNNETI